MERPYTPQTKPVLVLLCILLTAVIQTVTLYPRGFSFPARDSTEGILGESMQQREAPGDGDGAIREEAPPQARGMLK